MTEPTNQFPALLRPGSIGRLRLRNRLVMSPMETMYGDADGHPTERTIAYFAARAAGGVGLITVGATGIDPLHPETPGGLQIGTDAAVSAHRELVAAVHEHGAKIQPQIVHAGPDGLGPELHGVTSLGPSVIPSYLTGNPSSPATKEQIGTVLDQFRAAAGRVREAGYDGMELHAAHGYMFLGSFLTPQRNRRGDRYRGTSMEGRLRVILEALAAIRTEVGADFPITLRISGTERVAGGRLAHDTARAAPVLVEGGVDAFHVSGGVIDRLVTQMVNGSSYPDGLNLAAAAAVKQSVDVPVIAVGRIHDPALADAVVAAGRADFIAMGRPLLADPDLPNKLAAGEPERVRPCISCQNCIDSLEQRFSTDCAVNPLTGAEATYRVGSKPERGHGRTIVVIGGGPAGLEAARLAGLRGDTVTVYERSARVGGSARRAGLANPLLDPYLGWLEAEARRVADIQVGVSPSAAQIRELAPDLVLLAHGGRSVVDRPSGTPGDDVLVQTIDELDLDRPPTGHRVVVLGEGPVALGVATRLAELGRQVTVLAPGTDPAAPLGPKRGTEIFDRLDRLGVTTLIDTVVDEWDSTGVVATTAGQWTRRHAADLVVLVGRIEAHPDALTLAEELSDLDVRTIGDASGFGLLQGATADAARAVLGTDPASRLSLG